MLIMSGCKTDEEREFYIRLCIKENYSKRRLERQLDSGYYERYMLSKETLLPESVKKLGENPFLDSYVMEFLDLPNEFHENDLRKALIRNMKDFILELGKDFTFIDEEYKVQVGGDDFRIDLLFYHRGLQCLVAIELKIGKFKPEYISKLDFYLEAHRLSRWLCLLANRICSKNTSCAFLQSFYTNPYTIIKNVRCILYVLMVHAKQNIM